MYSNGRKFIDGISDRFIKDGVPIAGGWAVYLRTIMPKDAGPVQISETQKAFYAGAQHLYSMIMHGLTEGSEPTETDLNRMANIEAELADWATKALMEIDGQKGGRKS